MLTRETYQMGKRKEIKELIVEILNNLSEMIDHHEAYFSNSTNETKENIFQNKTSVNNIEKRIEKYVVEVFTLEQLNKIDIKWFFAINRIIRELERCGDYLVNVITVSDLIDIDLIAPHVLAFFEYEKDMIKWLKKGIINDDIPVLEKVIDHDKHVNKLNKKTFKHVATQINDSHDISESELKMVVIGRFLERFGDHLVNTAKVYKKIIVE